jgi:MFS family permease
MQHNMDAGTAAQAGIGPQPYPGLREARFAQIVLIMIVVLAVMDIYAISVLIEPIKHELGLTDVQVGLVSTSAIYLSFALFCIPMGMLADRYNRVRMLVGAVLIWCVGLAIIGLSTGLGMLVAGKALLGLANALTIPASLSLMSDYFAPDRRPMAVSSYGVGQVVGQAGAILVGGWGFGALSRLAEAHPDALFGLSAWRVLSLMIACAGLALLPFLLRMREPARQDVGDARQVGFRELWAYRSFLLPVFAGIGFITAAAVGILAWIPPVLTRVYGQQPGDFAGWYGLVSLAGGVSGMLLAGRMSQLLRRRVGGKGLLLPACVGAFLCAPASLMSLMPNVPFFAAAVLMFLVFFALANAVPNIALTLVIPNEVRGTAVGANIVIVSLASALSSPLIAWIGEKAGGEDGLGHAMAAVGSIGGVVAAFFFYLASRGHTALRPAISGPAVAASSS